MLLRKISSSGLHHIQNNIFQSPRSLAVPWQSVLSSLVSMHSHNQLLLLKAPWLVLFYEI